MVCAGQRWQTAQRLGQAPGESRRASIGGGVRGDGVGWVGVRVNILRRQAHAFRSPPTIDPVAARRWAALPHPDSPWLHQEVARRMAERLPWIRLPVTQWGALGAVGGGQQARARVAAHYRMRSVSRS
jgi:hypothetical protein